MLLGNGKFDVQGWGGGFREAKGAGPGPLNKLHPPGQSRNQLQMGEKATNPMLFLSPPRGL
jgi:hypothetical protein